jgi:hypothetical protein
LSEAERALAALDRFGLLLFSDPALPSLVGLIVGEPLRRSWWGHPRGGVIYQAMNALADDPAVLSTKLIAGKVTYVHPRLWAAVYALGRAREGWQMGNLSTGALWLLEQVDADDEVRTDLLVPPPMARVPDASRELERRLLVHATEVHTPSGAHAKVLQTWPRWAAEHAVEASPLSNAEARDQLEDAARHLTAEVVNGVAELPWQRPISRRRVASA